MPLLDTVVLIASLDPDHRLHRRALHHLKRLKGDPDMYVPSAAVLEADLEMKSHGFSSDERREACASLMGYIPDGRVTPITLEVISKTVELENVSGYFDALIAATALAHGEHVVTTDKAFEEMGVKITW